MRRSKQPMRIECCFVAMLLMTFGCNPSDSNPEETSSDDIGNEHDGGTDSPPMNELAVHLAFQDSDAAPDFSAAVVFDDGTTARIYCSEERNEASDGFACMDSGVRITGVFDGLHLIVKAREYQFVTESLILEELEMEGSEWIHTVSVSPLDSFEVDEEYRTGFLEDELDEFVEMAYPSATEMGAVHAVKFVITDLSTRPIVYFQNTRRNPIHYDFARTVLGLNMTSAEFWAATYSGEDRQLMAGTVLLYEGVNSECERLERSIVRPLALTFFPSDDLTAAQARLAHRLIEERLGFSPLTGETNRFFYLPAGEDQEADLKGNAQLFAHWDADWVLHREIYRQLTVQIMNPGLAYGTLRLAESETLESEVFSFRDIVVLPTLPIELPIVGGTITEEFQTPLSHVNLMAKNRGTPNISLRDATSLPEITSLLGKLVRFEVTGSTYTLEETTLEQAEAFWDETEREEISLETDLETTGFPGLEDIGFDDSISVGAKAANLAELAALLGDQELIGFAVPFSHYDRFMRETQVDDRMCASARSDCLEEGRPQAVCDDASDVCGTLTGRSLWDYVTGLMSLDLFNTDTVLREAALDGVRYHIRNTPVSADFAEALDERALEVFGTSKLRLRSSTNAEDIPGFTGAGLYESVGAYATLADDLPSDEIRKVWASVWNWRAFEERSFRNIQHLSTFMGVAVNQAFVDEAANGVLITQNIADFTVAGMYVNVQLGDVSVTNPEGEHAPEIFSIIPGARPGTVQTARLEYSTLSPSTPIMTDEEIAALYESAMTVHNHFAELYNVFPTVLAMDLEFKLTSPTRALVIKQARPYVY